MLTAQSMAAILESMVTRDYECKKCDKAFSVKSRVTEEPLTECDCGARLKRVYGAPVIEFKGTGWAGKKS